MKLFYNRVLIISIMKKLDVLRLKFVFDK